LRSTCPLSSSSKAENAESNSFGGDRDDKSVEIEVRNAGRLVVWACDGGKKGETSVVEEGRPGIY
jgi:hypothetical protein